jgi:uncharacterized protein (DUF433 family)
MMDAMPSVLDRDVFSVPEAARHLRVPTSTLTWWLDGRGRHRPVIRPERTGRRVVTWAEFVEAGFLRQYRRQEAVPLRELRRFVERLRDDLGVPYPLAHAQPWVGEGKKLLLSAQEDAGLAPEFCLVAFVSDQLVLTGPSDSFVHRVRFENDVAIAWRPHDDERSPVEMRPDVRFGRPAIKGISTEAIWEHIEADEGIDEVADQFDLTIEDVRWAVSYESSLRAAA